MLEDDLRETFAAKAGSPPSGSLTSLDGFADAAIAGARRVRRRRRAAVTGASSLLAVAVAAIAVMHTLTGGAPAPIQQAGGDQPGIAPQVTPSQPGVEDNPSPLPMREFQAIGPSAQAATKVRLQLPSTGDVDAAYQAKDGYLVVSKQEDGGKKLVLQDDDSDKSQVLVDDATDITVAKDGKTVAWAAKGKVNVGTRAATDTKKITVDNSAPVELDTAPVTFVGTSLVLTNETLGFDVWHTERGYSPTWDKTVIRVFGGTTDLKGVYAEVAPVAPETAMCLALLAFDQPFKTEKRICGLPVAAKAGGGRISPDGHWFAYPVEGAGQVAVLDLGTVFTGGKAKMWPVPGVTEKTVWLNSTTFVCDNGKKILKVDPTGKAGYLETLDEQSKNVVLIEPLAAQ